MLRYTLLAFVVLLPGFWVFGQLSVGLGAGYITFTEKVVNIKQPPGWTLYGGATLENDQPFFFELYARYQKNKNLFAFSAQMRSIYYSYTIINQAGFGAGFGHGNDLFLNLQLSYGRKFYETGIFSFMPMAGLGMATANRVSGSGTGSFGTTDLENNLLTGTDTTFTSLKNAVTIPLSLLGSYHLTPDISINFTLQYSYNLSPYLARETVRYCISKNMVLQGNGSGFVDQKNITSVSLGLSYHFGKKSKKSEIKKSKKTRKPLLQGSTQ